MAGRLDKHLMRLSEKMLNVSPGVSRFLSMQSKERSILREGIPDVTVQQELTKSCPYCGQIFDTTNHHVRIKARQKLTAKHRKLLNKEQTNPQTLGKYQQNFLQAFRKSRNIVVLTCHTCSKSTRLPGQTRQERPTVKKQQKHSTVEEIHTIKEKSRKEKRKEKKKLKKREKKSMIANTSVCTVSSLQKKKQLPDEEIIPLETKKGTSSYDSKVCAGSNKTPVNSVTNSFNRTKQTEIGITFQNREKKNISTAAKKKKSKDKHQMLSKMLTQEKKSSDFSSLSSFLSTL